MVNNNLNPNGPDINPILYPGHLWEGIFTLDRQRGRETTLGHLPEEGSPIFWNLGSEIWDPISPQTPEKGMRQCFSLLFCLGSQLCL